MKSQPLHCSTKFSSHNSRSSFARPPHVITRPILRNFGFIAQKTFSDSILYPETVLILSVMWATCRRLPLTIRDPLDGSAMELWAFIESFFYFKPLMFPPCEFLSLYLNKCSSATVLDKPLPFFLTLVYSIEECKFNFAICQLSPQRF